MNMFEKFLKMHTPEQRSSIKAVSGDGAKWIDQCMAEYLPNARIEAANNKIKLIIRKAYGFREVKNLIDMVMLVCSNLRIPLEHREGRDGKKRSGHL